MYKRQDKGGDVDEFRVLQEAYEALRDGGGGVEEAKESSPAASPAGSYRITASVLTSMTRAARAESAARPAAGAAGAASRFM